MTTFPLARYRLEWRVSTTLRLPDYAGSMLRGAFGRALRQVACMTRQKDCAGIDHAGRLGAHKTHYFRGYESVCTWFL